MKTVDKTVDFILGDLEWLLESLLVEKRTVAFNKIATDMLEIRCIGHKVDDLLFVANNLKSTAALLEKIMKFDVPDKDWRLIVETVFKKLKAVKKAFIDCNRAEIFSAFREILGFLHERQILIELHYPESAKAEKEE